MKRTWKMGLAAALGAVLLAGGATAFAFGSGPGHFGGHRGHGMMRHFVSATIDDALDEAKVTPQQRDQVHVARDKAFAALEEHMKGHGAHVDEALALFEADQVDAAKIQSLRAEREAEARQVGDAITQALVETHDVLTPAQRKSVADYVRSHRPGHME